VTSLKGTAEDESFALRLTLFETIAIVNQTFKQPGRTRLLSKRDPVLQQTEHIIESLQNHEFNASSILRNASSKRRRHPDLTFLEVALVQWELQREVDWSRARRYEGPLKDRLEALMGKESKQLDVGVELLEVRY
jgi:hypothetical protein